MDKEIDDLIVRLTGLEDELDRKLEERRAALQYRVEKQRVVFEKNIIRQHKRIKTGLITFLRRSPLAALVVSPVVYSLIVPLIVLDVGVSLFQKVCFSAWGIRRIPRSEFVVIDRHHLAYLNGIEKLNCMYCGEPTEKQHVFQ